MLIEDDIRLKAEYCQNTLLDDFLNLFFKYGNTTFTLNHVVYTSFFTLFSIMSIHVLVYYQIL